MSKSIKQNKTIKQQNTKITSLEAQLLETRKSAQRKVAYKKPVLPKLQLESTMSNAPIAISNRLRSRKPVFKYHEDGSIIITHAEYVTDVMSDPGNDFAYDVFAVNPGNSSLFPWLSLIARQFEFYEFLDLKTHYFGLQPTTTSGDVILVVDYDSQDNTGSPTKAQLLAYKGWSRANMWDHCQQVNLHADMNRTGKSKYVNESSTLDNPTDRLSSSGNLFVATSATNAALPTTTSGVFFVTTLGELFVEYTVKLSVPAQHVPGSFTSVAVGTAATGAGTDLLGSMIQTVTAGPATQIGVTVGPANVTDPNGGTGNAWVAAGSGAAVPPNQTLIKFAKDFEGVIRFVHNDSTTGYASAQLSPSPPIICVPANQAPSATGINNSSASITFANFLGSSVLGQTLDTFEMLVYIARGMAIAINGLGSTFGYSGSSIRVLRSSQAKWKLNDMKLGIHLHATMAANSKVLSLNTRPGGDKNYSERLAEFATFREQNPLATMYDSEPSPTSLLE